MKTIEMTYQKSNLPIRVIDKRKVQGGCRVARVKDGGQTSTFEQVK